MRAINNLKDFLKSKKSRNIYRYRLSNTRYLKILIANKLFKEFSEIVTRRIRIVHDEICNEKVLCPLEQDTWEQMQKRLFKVVSTIQPHERIRITVLYEIDENFELTIEVRTSIK